MLLPTTKIGFHFFVFTYKAFEKSNTTKTNYIINDFTAPPQLGTVSPLDACAQSQNNDQDRAGTRGRNA